MIRPMELRRRIERAHAAAARLPDPSADPDAFYGALVALLERDGLAVTGACWHLTDPLTGLFSWTGHRGELPGDFQRALENELGERDVAKYAELAGRRAPVARLVAETGGEPRRSPRYRRMLAPDGFGDELRLAFVDPFGRWGSLGLFSEREFGADDEALAASLVAPVARALRDAAARTAPAPGDGEEAPGVLLLDGADRVRSRDAVAERLLGGRARSGELPGVVHVLAARARAAAGAVSGRTLGADGRWLTLDATPLLDEPDAVAIVLRPATAPSLLPLRLRAAGLTAREREIALALLRGDDTGTIAASLHLSPWTVQDHLKAIFAKTGVRSRRAFVATWALRTAGLEP